MADWQGPIEWAIWGVIMAVVMGALARSRNKARPPMEGNTLVQPKGILVLGVICAGFFAVCAAFSFSAKSGGPAVASVFVAFALLGAVIILDYYRARHTLTSSGLEYGTLFKGRHRLSWGEVTSVRYSQASKWFVIESSGRPAARISAMLAGLQRFAEEVLKHVPHSRIEPQTLQVLKDTAQGNLPSIWK